MTNDSQDLELSRIPQADDQMADIYAARSKANKERERRSRFLSQGSRQILESLPPTERMSLLGDALANGAQKDHDKVLLSGILAGTLDLDDLGLERWSLEKDPDAQSHTDEGEQEPGLLRTRAFYPGDWLIIEGTEGEKVLVANTTPSHLWRGDRSRLFRKEIEGCNQEYLVISNQNVGGPESKVWNGEVREISGGGLMCDPPSEHRFYRDYYRDSKKRASGSGDWSNYLGIGSVFGNGKEFRVVSREGDFPVVINGTQVKEIEDVYILRRSIAKADLFAAALADSPTQTSALNGEPFFSEHDEPRQPETDWTTDMPEPARRISRRQFLKAAAIVGGGIAGGVGLHLLRSETNQQNKEVRTRYELPKREKDLFMSTRNYLEENPGLELQPEYLEILSLIEKRLQENSNEAARIGEEGELQKTVIFLKGPRGLSSLVDDLRIELVFPSKEAQEQHGDLAKPYIHLATVYQTDKEPFKGFLVDFQIKAKEDNVTFGGGRPIIGDDVQSFFQPQAGFFENVHENDLDETEVVDIFGCVAGLLENSSLNVRDTRELSKKSKPPALLPRQLGSDEQRI